jgi:chromosomal replication initiator protein
VNAKQIWQTAIERLQAKVSPTIFTAWFQGTSALSYQDGVFIVRVPTTFAREYLEKRFSAIIRSALTEIIGVQIDIQFVVAEDAMQAEGNNGVRKRPYRLLRNRHSSTQRERRLSESIAATMNSLAPIAGQASVHRDPERSEAGTEAEAEPPETYQPQLLPEQPDPTPPGPEPEHIGTPTLLPPEEDENDFEPVPLIKQKASIVPLRGPIILPGEGLLNTRYTFNAFIVGKSNQLAHAASFAVSENPGHIYNPLFLYGGVGLGKTHLLHAVGHVGEAAGLTVLYTTSEKFTNEIINAIRFQKTEEFRAKYRQIDILLVDDIQFIAGKESTEEEFFHTFNTLHNANKQIVVTSDRPPKAIHSLQDRLRSRFEWGLLADVQAPEYEHRLAILRSKAESLHFRIPNAVIDYIARPESNSVRELEGSLNRVIAYATLNDQPMTVAVAAKALEHLYSDKRPSTGGGLTISEILAGVCQYYNIRPELLRGRQRERDIVWPRQVAMYLMREETGASLLQIGQELGKDHTTILHGWEKVNAEMVHNDRVRHEIAAVLDSLQQRHEI